MKITSIFKLTFPVSSFFGLSISYTYCGDKICGDPSIFSMQRPLLLFGSYMSESRHNILQP